MNQNHIPVFYPHGCRMSHTSKHHCYNNHSNPPNHNLVGMSFHPLHIFHRNHIYPKAKDHFDLCLLYRKNLNHCSVYDMLLCKHPRFDMYNRGLARYRIYKTSPYNYSHHNKHLSYIHNLLIQPFLYDCQNCSYPKTYILP